MNSLIKILCISCSLKVAVQLQNVNIKVINVRIDLEVLI
jgi:hypothetical protein